MEVNEANIKHYADYQEEKIFMISSKYAGGLTSDFFNSHPTYLYVQNPHSSRSYMNVTPKINIDISKTE